MKIALRTATGWTPRVKNIKKNHCDICGAKLWAGPGKQIYCDVEHKNITITSKANWEKFTQTGDNTYLNDGGRPGEEVVVAGEGWEKDAVIAG